MAATPTHIAIADQINAVLGDGVIKNLPLFFGGNIAPDAIHAKKDYQRADKKHTHLCDGIRSYGYGYPGNAKLFKNRMNEFIEKYYMTAGENKDLYFGYIVHLLVDELYLFSVFERLEEHLQNNGADTNAPGFRKKLANEISDDPQTYNEAYVRFFREAATVLDISADGYAFKQNAVEVLEAVWDYEIKDYISVNEINTSKRWVLNTFFKGEKTKCNPVCETATNFVTFAANDIINRLACTDGIVQFLQ